MEFEWDENKNRTNRAKHGLSFETARAAFKDAYALCDQDRYVDGEERWQVTALIDLSSLSSWPTYRDAENGEEIIRIISARRAESPERRRYDRARLGEDEL